MTSVLTLYKSSKNNDPSQFGSRSSKTESLSELNFDSPQRAFKDYAEVRTASKSNTKPKKDERNSRTLSKKRDAENAGSENTLAANTPLHMLFDKIPAQERIDYAYEALLYTRILMPDDLDLASPRVLEYLWPSVFIMETITSTGERLRRCVEKLTADSVDRISGVVIWLEICGKLSLLCNWTDRDLLRIRSGWIQLFGVAKAVSRGLKSLRNSIQTFQNVFQRRIRKLLRKNVGLLAHFKSCVPPAWTDILEIFEEYENSKKNSSEVHEVPAKSEIRVKCTPEDVHIIFEQENEPVQSPPVKIIKFSRLKEDVKCQLVCQVLGNLSFLMSQILNEVQLGSKQYLGEIPLKLRTLKSARLKKMHHFDYLLLTYGLQGLLESHVQNVFLFSKLQKSLHDFNAVLTSAREGFHGFNFDRNKRKLNPSLAISRFLTEFQTKFLEFEIGNYKVKKNRIMASLCHNFVLLHGETLKEMFRIQWIELDVSSVGSSFAAGSKSSAKFTISVEPEVEPRSRNYKSIVYSHEHESHRTDMEDYITKFYQSFISQVVGGMIRMLQILQVPKASTTFSQTTIGPPPVGFLEGLCHIISITSSQLKLNPERHRREAEPLRKQFLTLTNAIANLSELSRGTGHNVAKKLEPVLTSFEIEANLDEFLDEQFQNTNFKLPIVQSPNVECVQATWEDDAVSTTTSVNAEWNSTAEIISCTLNATVLKFDDLEIGNQFKIFKSFLAQALHSVEEATRISLESNGDLKKAKETLSSFWSYLQKVETKYGIRPEEKYALLLVFKAHMETTHYLVDQLIRTLKRCRVSLSYAIWHIRTKLGLLDTEKQNPGTFSKGNPFGYSEISVEITQPIDKLAPLNKMETNEGPSQKGDFHVTQTFFRRLSASTEEVTGNCLSSLFATQELLCGSGFGRNELSQSRVVALLLLLGQAIVGIANFRDCPQIQHSLLKNGINQLLVRLKKIISKSSLQDKLRQELEAAEKEAELISNELLVSMNVTWTPVEVRGQGQGLEPWKSKVFGEVVDLLVDVPETSLWMLKLEPLNEDSEKFQLLLIYEGAEIFYRELSRAKQGRVVIEIIQFLLALLDEVFVSLRQAAYRDLQDGAENLRSIKSELKNFLRKDNFGATADIALELHTLINLLHRAKETAGETFAQINSEVLKACRLLQYIKVYVNIRLKIEVPAPSRTALRPGLRKRRKWRPRAVDKFRMEQLKQINRKYKRKVRKIEAYLHTSLKNTKSIQVPLKLQFEGWKPNNPEKIKFYHKT